MTAPAWGVSVDAPAKALLTPSMTQCRQLGLNKGLLVGLSLRKLAFHACIAGGPPCLYHDITSIAPTKFHLILTTVTTCYVWHRPPQESLACGVGAAGEGIGYYAQTSEGRQLTLYLIRTEAPSTEAIGL